MKTKTKALRCGCAAILLCALFPFFETAQDQSPAPMERFALVAGSNAGGPGRVQLKYADSDARSIATVLTELGGVSDSDLILLSNPGLPAFREALQRMRQKVSAAESRGKDCQLVFYYSGHSDETGLFLGADKLSYSTLRSDIEQVPGSVRVIILDSCASGALTSGDARYRCSVALTQSQPVTITTADFQKAPLEATTARGEESGSESVAGDSRSVAFSVNFLPDFTTGLFSSRVDRTVAINILAESSENLAGFEVAGLLNAESGKVTGFQAAGLANLVMQDVTGFQAAGLVNWGDKVSFAQCAGLANVATGGLKGGQFAGLTNVALDDSTGTQLAGIVNYSSGTFSGAQIAGVANLATGSTDCQVGLLNVADTVHGLQVGLVNVAREMDGLPIGLVSLESGGIRNIEAWWDTSLMANLGIKLGTRHTYTLIEGGYVPASNPVQWSYGLGWGGRIAIGRIPIDADLSWRNTITGQYYQGNDSSSVNPQLELRMLAGIPIAGFSIVAGAALDARIPWLSWKTDDTRASDFEILVPRLIIGLRI